MAITLDGTLGITSPAETVQGPLTTTGNTILGDASTDTLNVGNGGLVKDASGNVGIGTATTTNAKLTVNANTVLPATAPPIGTNLWVTGADAALGRITLDSFGASGNFTFRTSNGTAAAPTATLANGAIGGIAAIGYGATAYPSTSRSSMVSYAAENWTDTAQGTYQIFTTTAIGAATNTERMRIDSSGNVGIGTATTNPAGFGKGVNLDGTGTSGYQVSVGGTLTGYFSAYPSETRIGSISTNPMTFYTNSSERMRIDSSGNVGIGTASPAHLLDVVGGGARAKYLQVTNGGYAGSAATTPELYSPSSGTLAIAAGGAERMRIDSSGNLLFNSGYGSAATAYGCRAWVNFNGTGTVAIRASGNVSSITDNGTGDYTVNFTTAMVDANYAVSLTTGGTGNSFWFRTCEDATARTSSALRIITVRYSDAANQDAAQVNLAFFR